MKILLIACSWLLATGLQWDLLQVVAWGRMFAGYSDTMSFTEAVEQTFEGEMCSMCKVVATAKQQEQAAADFLAAGDRIQLLQLQWCTYVFTGDGSPAWPVEAGDIGESLSYPPGLPPPRGQAV